MDTKITVPVLMPVLDTSDRSDFAVGRENLFHSLRFAGVDTDPLIVKDERGEGFVKTFNRGIRMQLEEDYDWKWLCLWMADMRCDQYGWLKRLIEVGDSDRSFGFVGPSMASGTPPQCEGEPGSLHQHEIVLHVSFGGCIIRRDILETVGLLNEDYQHYGADYELMNLAAERGWNAVWVHDVWIDHDWTPNGFPKWVEKDRPLYYSRWDREGNHVIG